MSTPAAVPESPGSCGIAVDLTGVSALAPVSTKTVTRILSGTSALGVSLAVEKGFGFIANILAARFAGAGTFGSYSLAVGTANTISTYAAGNIGSTAARFSGKYPFGSSRYSALARSLVVVSLTSAVLASGSLWLGAPAIAKFLHKTSMTSLLRWAAISASGIILLECARGFFVGQRRIIALLVLSMMVGIGMVCLLPAAASMHRPTRMILSQGLVALAAVALCLLFSKPLRLRFRQTGVEDAPMGPVLKEVWAFGGIQLAGLAGANLSGWWLTALVARADTTLIQMSFLTIASQLRNLTGLIPGLLTEGSYAVMADPDGEHRRTPHQVMALCTFATTSCTLIPAVIGMLAVPWILVHLYGQTYRGAESAAGMALAVAVVHMGNAPVIARLSIVSIRAVGVINAVWAVMVALSATLMLFRGGGAALAMTIFFAAHTTSAFLALFILSRKEHVASGMWTLFLLSTGAITATSGLFWMRQERDSYTILLSCLMAASAAAAAVAMYGLGKQHGWLPTKKAIHNLLANFQPLRLFRWRQAHGS